MNHQTRITNSGRPANASIATLIISVVVLFAVQIFIFGCGNLEKAPEPGSKQEEAARPSEIKVTLRDYLARSSAELPDYGLYSYILLSRKPATSKERERYIALHRAFRNLSRLIDIQAGVLDSLIKPENINISYWPVQIDHSDLVARDSLENSNTSDAFFVDNYDYLRAELILGHIQGIRTPGPFIVSYHYPLTKLPEEFEKDEVLLIDLTRVDQGQFANAMQYFQRKVLNDPQTWHNQFNWEMIRIHVYSALTLHGEPILFAAKWIGDFFSIKQAFARP